MYTKNCRVNEPIHTINAKSNILIVWHTFYFSEDILNNVLLRLKVLNKSNHVTMCIYLHFYSPNCQILDFVAFNAKYKRLEDLSSISNEFFVWFLLVRLYVHICTYTIARVVQYLISHD